MIGAIVYLLIPMACCLQILELRVPDLVDVRDHVVMSCKFALEGRKLYSVKWYKDDSEFYRYMPNYQPNVSTFPVTGVHLVKSKSNETFISLENLQYATSGTYRCEVSAEAPDFKTVWSHSNMTVLGLPKEDPLIEGVVPTYSVGDYVLANCTSSPSYPVAQLMWHINDEKAENWLLLNYHIPLSRHPLKLQSSTLGLKMLLDLSHFRSREGLLTLKCTATVATVTRQTIKTSYLAKLQNEQLIRGHDFPKNIGRCTNSSAIMTLLIIMLSYINYFLK